MFPIRLLPSKTKVNFLAHKHLAFISSFLLIIFTIFLLSTKGLNKGIDFTGGVIIEVRFNHKPDLAKLRGIFSDKELGDISLQNFGGENDVIIRIGRTDLDNGQQVQKIAQIKSILATNYEEKIDYRRVDFVGPTIGRELIKSGSLALIVSFIAIMLYIALRFSIGFGLAALVALIHDAILTIGFFSFMSLEFNLTSIAAILTIIGYSINDSVVIFDRIRENMQKFKQTDLEEVINKSINGTLSRTILTAGTTIIALLSLVIFGGAVLKSFSLAVLFGVVIGTYSSVYIAAPLLIFMKVKKDA
jgi:preprotein translocase subunit SecF